MPDKIPIFIRHPHSHLVGSAMPPTLRIILSRMDFFENIRQSLAGKKIRFYSGVIDDNRAGCPQSSLRD